MLNLTKLYSTILIIKLPIMIKFNNNESKKKNIYNAVGFLLK